ncbi:hypothetical protein VC83_08201 [Pseudogymnoascus destructans]|uniref:Uncharacterized protein n=1 Tax=Pseudogymnoascus destructans TaxID=655981 RepID=A0A177A1F6_9PEZI|nr:uncharacterized protein VC83_08201 [Pseudogymnoascus destructans]OAF55322.1 hypothetical protein VC83_08201 [Pseudogymnoascus destructans]
MAISNFLNPEEEVKVEKDDEAGQEQVLQDLIAEHLGVCQTQDDDEEEQPEEPVYSIQEARKAMQVLIKFTEDLVAACLAEPAAARTRRTAHPLHQKHTAVCSYYGALDEQFKAELGSQKPPTSPLGEASSTIAPHAPATGRRGRIRGEDKLFEYRRYVQEDSVRLTEPKKKNADPADSLHSADLASQQNAIEQDPDKRWKQMCQLVQDGLHRT